MSNTENGRIAVFDLDGTLYDGHILRGIVRHNREHRVNRVEVFAFVGIHFPLWYLGKLVSASELAIRSIWARHMGWMMRGWRAEEDQGRFEWIAREYFLPRVRADVMERLRRHQEAGERVILLSGTPAPLLASIGAVIGVRETVGTPLIERGGKYTGESESPACQGPGKVERLLIHLREGEPIDWSASTCYADSEMDMPVLELFGDPVAVSPDEQLRARAQQAGWEILE